MTEPALPDATSPTRLTVLGSTGAYPEPGGACSGFVVETGEFAVALDLGWGTLPRLLEHLGSPVAAGLSALVVTHDHPDHTADVPALVRARWYGARTAPAIPLLCPRPVLERLLWAEDDATSMTAAAMEWHEAPGRTTIGPFEIETLELPHYVTNVGVRLTTGGRTLAYTGDTGPDDAVVSLGRDVDLFIVDATDRHQQDGVPQAPPEPDGQPQGDEKPAPTYNLTATEAGELAQQAGAKRLLLTHFWPGNDRELSRKQAQAEFAGEVLIAEPGLSITL